MGFLNALGTVSRRSRWRRPLVFYDFVAGALHDVTDATLSLTLFREDPNRVPHRFGPDFAGGCWLAGWTPPLVVTSDDGNGYLLPDGSGRGKLDVPSVLVATVPEGLYWASVIATFPDGSYVEVLREAVRFTGPALPPPPLKPFLTADSDVAGDSGDPVSGSTFNDLGQLFDQPLTADSTKSVDTIFPNNGLPAGAPPINAPLT